MRLALLPVCGCHQRAREVQCLLNQATLDVLVQGRVRVETRKVVHLDEPRLSLMVNHRVDAQNLEAAAAHTPAANVLGVGVGVCRLQSWLHRYEGLYAEGGELTPQPLTLFFAMLLFHIAHEPLQGALAPGAVIVGVYVRFEVLALLVHGVVGEMHTTLVQRLGRGRGVGGGAETHKAVFEEEASRLEEPIGGEQRANEKVQPQVELQPIDQHWPSDVLLDDERLLAFRRGSLDAPQLRCKEDAAALALGVRLDDVDGPLPGCGSEVPLQLAHFLRDSPCCWQEAVLRRKRALDPCHVPRQTTLPPHLLEDAREVVHPHPRLNLGHPLTHGAIVDPMHIGLGHFPLRPRQLPASRLRRTGHDIIVAVTGIEEDSAGGLGCRSLLHFRLLCINLGCLCLLICHAELRLPGSVLLHAPPLATGAPLLAPPSEPTCPARQARLAAWGGHGTAA
mmetsp:Transcript_85514/g.191147  ORF Transcript_85514/g.191147 Transcript_85514/m.191147 type:complete len:450 (-) Transcript_85514:12-1361(-)